MTARRAISAAGLLVLLAACSDSVDPDSEDPTDQAEEHASVASTDD